MTRVKICGFTREEDVDAAVDAGADAVGFITGFPTSPRNLSVTRVSSLMSRVPPFVTTVLVTTTDALIEDSDALKRMAPRAIQVYGRPFAPEAIRDSVRTQFIRAFAVHRDESAQGADVVSRAKEAVRGYDALLVDTYQEGQEGGTGLTSDWGACAAIRRAIAAVPLILSGGLRPENVEAAIAAVSPFCVDVSSGVESSPGLKDHAKIREFVSKASRREERRVEQ